MAKKSYLTATDQFCGAGGSSIGATKAGVEVRLAMNHWKLAIETHNTNFPNVDHDCTDISAVNPRRYPSTDILITSPECTNHSIAKGKPRQYYQKDIFGNVLIDPSEERSRATMWDVPRFAEFHDYRMIVVENVIDAGRWRLFDAWIRAMTDLDYDHEVVYLNSMFAWPTPQSRDRMYTVFWKRGNRKPDLEFRPVAWCEKCQGNVNAIQTWKRSKWGKYRAQYFYRCPTCHSKIEPYYYAAFNAIDFSIRAERIGDRKKPLRPNTMARVRYGFETYGKKPLIVASPGQPENTGPAVIMPWLVELGFSQAPNNRAISTADAGMTQTTRQTIGAVGFLSRQYGGDADPKYLSIGLDEPTGTITTWDHHAIITTPPGFIAELHGQSKASALNDPLMCVLANGGHHALVSSDAFLTYYYNTLQASAITDPINTITTLDRAALVGALSNMTVEDLTFRMLQPHEISRAMAFPDSYIVKGTKKEKVKQYGNAVTPPAMEMILRRCIDTFS